jgi:glutaminase
VAAGRARAFGQRVQLDRPARKRAWHPAQPFINAGAIVVSDILLGNHEPREAIGEMLRFVRALASDETIRIDETVAQGELQTGFRNIALANYMRAFGNVRHPVEKVLGLYFHQCAIAMSCRQLAAAGRYLMARGRHPESGRSVVSPAARAASMP